MCGLKHNGEGDGDVDNDVTPFVGVWIETYKGYQWKYEENVTPFVGVWIETERV